jgi:DNA phosphorothioation-dependent restriction protein DptF
MKRCLIDELAHLKQSSKEAVENLEEFSDFKKYLHVERSCERELKIILEEIQGENRPHLVLVCGSVGDGKSHLISFLKNEYPHLFKNVVLHNDATESFHPTKTFEHTLREQLKHFTDEALSNKPVAAPHIVVAINLGTLNNFLNSVYHDEYRTLANYVEKTGIMKNDRTRQVKRYLEGIPIRHINLSDYHLYELTEKGIISSFQEELLEKITAKTKVNPIGRTYLETCLSCPIAQKCPVKKNYELLEKKEVQRSIIQRLAEVNIKYKTIISPRTFNDLLYHILVDAKISSISSDNERKEKIKSLSDLDFLGSLLPNLFYEIDQQLERFTHIKYLEPSQNRTPEMDKLTIRFFNTTDLKPIFHTYLDEETMSLYNLDAILNRVENADREGNGALRRMLYLTLLRLDNLYPAPNDKNIIQEDSVYKDYVRYLYYWNHGDPRAIKDLYISVINSLYFWNGNLGKEKVQLNIGRKQAKYIVYQHLKINIAPLSVPYSKPGGKLEQFSTDMVLHFRADGSKNFHPVDIDFHLYKLIDQVNKGYRLSHQDHNNYVNFVDLLERLSRDGSQQNKVEFRHKLGKDHHTYQLYIDEFGDYVFKVGTS